MGIESASTTSEIWGDLYSVYRALWDDTRIPLQRVYFDKVEGHFVRPSAQVKFITFRPKTRDIFFKTVEEDIMVKYFAHTEFEAMAAADVIVDILSGWPEKILPRYDFSVSPPEKLSITGLDDYGRTVSRDPGIRVDPDSIKADPFRSEDDLWEVPVTFTMTAPRHRVVTESPIITSISYETLLVLTDPAQGLSVMTQTVPSVEQL